ACQPSCQTVTSYHRTMSKGSCYMCIPHQASMRRNARSSLTLFRKHLPTCRPSTLRIVPHLALQALLRPQHSLHQMRCFCPTRKLHWTTTALEIQKRSTTRKYVPLAVRSAERQKRHRGTRIGKQWAVRESSNQVTFKITLAEPCLNSKLICM